MVGRRVSLGGKKKSEPGTEPILQMKNICVQDQGRELLKDINLEVRRGEILGIAGIDGSGQDILVDVINGSLDVYKRQVWEAYKHGQRQCPFPEPGRVSRCAQECSTSLQTPGQPGGWRPLPL